MFSLSAKTILALAVVIMPMSLILEESAPEFAITGAKEAVIMMSSGNDSEFVLRVLSLDAKPGSCPNAFNPGSNGVLAISVVGSTSFDVTRIQQDTVRLSRLDGVGGEVAPLNVPEGPHTVIEDTSTPFPGSACECHELEGDGILDLSLKFSASEVKEVLELDGETGTIQILILGLLDNGRDFGGTDCIRLVPPGSENLTITSNLEDVYIQLDREDLLEDGNDWTMFSRVYLPFSYVTMSAPLVHKGRNLVAWRINKSFWRAPNGGTLRILIFGRVRVEALYDLSRATPLPQEG